MIWQKRVGVDRRIKLEWLEYTASLVLAGNSKKDVVAALHDRLKDTLAGGGSSGRGCRQKTITVLVRVWMNPPSNLSQFRDAGLELLGRIPASEHLAVHWSALMATYPFWKDVAEVVGRLLRLQGAASVSQVMRRISELYGERQTVLRSCQRLLRSFVDWGVLEDTETKGVFRQGKRVAVTDPKTCAWVLEALLRSGASSSTLTVTRFAPALFPFELRGLSLSEVENNERVELIRYNLDHTLIKLR